MDWQSLATYVLIAFAIGWTARRTWRTVRAARAAKGTLAGCTGCPQSAKAPERGGTKRLVQLRKRGQDS